MGGMPEPMRTLATDRCDNASSKIHVLAFYPDRVEAFTEDEERWELSHYCSFLLFSEDRVSTAVGLAQNSDEGFTVIYDAGERGGGLLMYDNHGVFIRKVEPNINLISPGGIWWIEGGYVVWSAQTRNLYRLDAEGNFQGSYTPPMQSSARLDDLTEMFDVGSDENGNARVLATFSNRAPQVFAFPDSPSFAEAEIKGVWATTFVNSQVGNTVVFSGEVDGSEGGLIQYRPIDSGRQVPARIGRTAEISHMSDGFGNGADLVPIYNELGAQGFFILDTSEDSGPQISSFDTLGTLQKKTSLEDYGSPKAILRTTIFKDLEN